MNKRISGAMVLAVVLAACGGEGDAAPAPKTAATTTPAPTMTAPATTSTGTTEATPPATPKPTMLELQKKAGSNMVASWAAHDAKKTAENYATDAVVMETGATGAWVEHKGRDEIQKQFADLYAGFPDSKLGIVRVFAAKNVCVVQWVMTGTNSGEFMGQKATNKPVGINGSSVVWYNDDGLVSKEHLYLDSGTIASQLGMSKQKARPVATLPTGDGEWITPKGDGSDEKAVAAFAPQLDAFNKRDAKAFGATLTDDAVHVDYTAAEDIKGKAAAEKEMGGYFKAFPDLKGTADNLWGFGDWVIDEATFTGTQTGPLGPIKATKKPVTIHMVEVNMTKDGKFAKTETYYNSVEMMGQLGLLPKPKETKEGKKAADPKAATPPAPKTP